MGVLEFHDGPVIAVEDGLLVVLMAANVELGLKAYWRRRVRTDFESEIAESHILKSYALFADACRRMPNAPCALIEVENRKGRVVRRFEVDRESVLRELDRRGAMETAGSTQAFFAYAKHPEALAFLGDPPFDEASLAVEPSAWSQLESCLRHGVRTEVDDALASDVEVLDGLMWMIVNFEPGSEDALRIVRAWKPERLVTRALEALTQELPNAEQSGWIDVLTRAISRRDQPAIEAAFVAATDASRWKIARGIVALIQDAWIDENDEARLRGLMAAAKDAHVDEVVMGGIG